MKRIIQILSWLPLIVFILGSVIGYFLYLDAVPSDPNVENHAGWILFGAFLYISLINSIIFIINSLISLYYIFIKTQNKDFFIKFIIFSVIAIPLTFLSITSILFFILILVVYIMYGIYGQDFQPEAIK